MDTLGCGCAVVRGRNGEWDDYWNDEQGSQKVQAKETPEEPPGNRPCFTSLEVDPTQFSQGTTPFVPRRIRSERPRPQNSGVQQPPGV
jgi:hypothetical protein